MGQGNCCREGLLDSMRHSTVARQGRVLKRRGTKRRDGVSRGEFFGTDTAGDAPVNRKDCGRKQRKRGLFTSGMPCRVGFPKKLEASCTPARSDAFSGNARTARGYESDGLNATFKDLLHLTCPQLHLLCQLTVC